MTVEVTISKLKSIDSLTFKVPVLGAFVITGANGCGKTSLLTALHRMGAHSAFQTGFPSSPLANGIDGIRDASITYSINGQQVSYRYNQIRWSATPKSLSKLVSTAFTEVLFLKANSSRVEPTTQELKTHRKTAADPRIKQFMNAVFDTNKFDQLVQIRLPGRDTIAHLIDISKPTDKKKSYYSEKAFSLGELCVLRLGQKLQSTRNGGLYIIDEFEMALHPAAQVRLFRETERIAKSANCAILVSTHSATLIKSVGRGRLIYLENDGGTVTVHTDVYPTYALQHIALSEENFADKLIFVEDLSARDCIESLWKEHLSTTNSPIRPSVHISVIGGYKEVLRFLERSQGFVPRQTKRMAVLDQDAELHCLPTIPVPGTPAAPFTVPQTLYQNLEASVRFLPWTPEVGFCELLRQNLPKHLRDLQQGLGITGLQLSFGEINAHVGLTGKPQRDQCKRTMEKISQAVAQQKLWTQERASEALFSYLVRATMQQTPAVLQPLRMV